MQHAQCKTCISYAICRTRILGALPENYNDETLEQNYPERLNFIASLAYYTLIKKGCHAIADMIDKEANKTGICNSQHDMMIKHVLWETFDL